MTEYRSKPQPSLASCCVSLGSAENRQKLDGLKQRTEIGAMDRQSEGVAKDYSSCALVLCRHVRAIPFRKMEGADGSCEDLQERM